MKANKTDAGNGSKAICRVSNVLRSPSPDPRRSPNPSASTLIAMKPAGHSADIERFTTLDLAFSSPVLATQFRRTASRIASSCAGLRSREMATVYVLLDCYAPMIVLTELGEESPECVEVIHHLLSPVLRDGLRQFYSDIAPQDMNPAAREFRERLSSLCHEQL